MANAEQSTDMVKTLDMSPSETKNLIDEQAKPMDEKMMKDHEGMMINPDEMMRHREIMMKDHEGMTMSSEEMKRHHDMMMNPNEQNTQK